MRFLLLLPILAPCTTPSPGFIYAGAPHGFADVGGNRFKVYYTQERAQVFRENTVFRPKVEVIQAQALVAAARVSGCRVKTSSAVGDAVRTDVALNCKA